MSEIQEDFASIEHSFRADRNPLPAFLEPFPRSELSDTQILDRLKRYRGYLREKPYLAEALRRS